jgi:transketolase
MRNKFAETLYACAIENPDIYVVVADISPAGSMAKFRQEHPMRFLNVGVAEQCMIGICAGLALKGCQPFAYTIANFSLYRPFEMVRNDLCYQNLPVTVVGMGTGVVYSTLGSTHHTQEDVAVASAVPNLRILAPCDPLETVEVTKYCAFQREGPVYLRLGKTGEPVLTDKAVEPFAFGRVRRITAGRDTAILAYGPILRMGASLAERLSREHGESVSLVSVHTIKPLDKAGVAEIIRSHRRVIVIEENVPHGGLGSRVKEIAWDMRATADVRCFALQDEFIHYYGEHEELLRRHGLDEERIFASLVGGP